MDLIKTNCSSCGRELEFPADFDSVVCSNCGTSYIVRDYKGTRGLSVLEPQAHNHSTPEQLVSELDEEIAVVASEIESIRSAEQSAPLQMGCALFSIFSLTIVVIAIFMTVGAKYFARWPFYLALGAVVLFAIYRMRHKLVSSETLEELRSRREELERGLSELESERSRQVRSSGVDEQREEHQSGAGDR